MPPYGPHNGQFSIANADELMQAASAGATFQVTAETADAKVLVAARATRRSVSITNESGLRDGNNNHVRWGYGAPPAQGVALSTGYILPAKASIEIHATTALWVIAVTDTGAAPVVSGAEEYDNA